MSGRLTDSFRELIELRWSELVDLERSEDATNFDSIVTSIARAASKGNLRSIQVALDRIDGKIATEIEVEYPKFYTLYPRATKTADDPAIIDVDEEFSGKEVTLSDGPRDVFVTGSPADVEEQRATEEELPTGSLRAVLDRMLNSPKTIVSDILLAKDQVDVDNLEYGNPRVKSVIVAGLMKLVHDGRVAAVFEVFDQIDGKVADKFKMLGDDVFIYNYSEIAPAGAVKNENGVYQIAADNTTNAWVARLEERNNANKR